MHAGGQPAGFIGLGAMGEPMALNIAAAGIPLVVWNRTTARCAAVAEAGARVADSVDGVFAACETVILMLADGAAIDSVLDRGGATFAARVSDHTIVHMGTTSPSYSRGLEADVISAGGRYVEAPVSGSRRPAEERQLVAMVAGGAEAVKAASPLFDAMCRATVACGAVPNALVTKLAANVFLIALVTGLAEAFHFARHHDLDLERLAAVLNVGQMASPISKVKTAKLLAGDLAEQASIANVLENNRLIAEAANEAGIASPLIDVCHALYRETLQLGLGEADMIAVVEAIEQRTATVSRLT